MKNTWHGRWYIDDEGTEYAEPAEVKILAEFGLGECSFQQDTFCRIHETVALRIFARESAYAS